MNEYGRTYALEICFYILSGPNTFILFCDLHDAFNNDVHPDWL